MAKPDRRNQFLLGSYQDLLASMTTHQCRCVHHQGRRFASTSSSSSNASFSSRINHGDNGSAMDKLRLYRYLQLQSFTKEELEQVFDRLCTYPDMTENPTNNNNKKPHHANDNDHIGLRHSQIVTFILQRINELELDHHSNYKQLIMSQLINDNNDKDDTTTTTKTEAILSSYAQQEANKFWRVFHPKTTTITSPSDNNDDDYSTIIERNHFVTTIINQATAVDIPRIWPITMSILLVGTSVGIVTPAMPFVVNNLGLSPGEYGTVVSGFALAKMSCNIPSAILVERHGRKVLYGFIKLFVAIFCLITV